jgi:hypothetical protein
MNSEKNVQGPRLVKAADLAARKAQEEIEEMDAQAKHRQKIESITKAAARIRVPRDARDARAVFDSLFGKPAA